MPLRTDEQELWRRVCAATNPRKFVLEEDWEVRLSWKRSSDLSGCIVVPTRYCGKVQIFDGASIPCPWIVSGLTFGILRPLGIMLVASIIHDFAFAHGELLYRGNNGNHSRRIRRADADLLFRDTIRCVNKLQLVAWFGYIAVRFGWMVGVRYRGRRWNWSEAPRSAMALLLGILVGLIGVSIAV